MNVVTPAGRGLGLVPDKHDTRDLLYRADAEASTAYKFVDLEPDPATPPIWDQEQIGSCTAHGTLACLLFAAAKAGVKDPMLSRLMLYWRARNIEGNADQDTGAQIRDAIKAAARGVAPESMWPYDTSRFAVKPPEQAFTAAKSNRALTYYRVLQSVGAIQSCLSAGFPIDIGVSLYPSFESDEAISSGVASLPTEEDLEQGSIGGHCMAVWGNGYGRDWIKARQFPEADPNTLYAKVRNSWGPSVYQRGYLLLPVKYLTDPHLGQDYWTIRTAS